MEANKTVLILALFYRSSHFSRTDAFSRFLVVWKHGPTEPRCEREAAADMRAVWYEGGGPAAEVLRIGELEAPQPGEGEVRVKVAYSSVNPFDIKKRVHGAELAYWDRVVPHVDGSGEIESVGGGVSESRVGERVWLFGAQVGQAMGSCAEYCVLPEWKAVALPEAVSLQHGACLPVPVVTALESLSVVDSLAGRSVLVAGGAGRVGACSVQIASAAGARVIATASSGKCTGVESLGAERCFDYRDPELHSQLHECVGKRGFDLVVESRFGGNAELNSRVLARGGTISAYGVDDAPTPEIPARRLMMKNANCRFLGIFVLSRKRLSTLFEQVNRVAVAPGFEFRIGAEVSLDEVATLHQRVEGGAVPGAALIRI